MRARNTEAPNRDALCHFVFCIIDQIKTKKIIKKIPPETGFIGLDQRKKASPGFSLTDQEKPYIAIVNQIITERYHKGARYRICLIKKRRRLIGKFAYQKINHKK